LLYVFNGWFDSFVFMRLVEPLTPLLLVLHYPTSLSTLFTN
jgi:hypothetical protein